MVGEHRIGRANVIATEDNGPPTYHGFDARWITLTVSGVTRKRSGCAGRASGDDAGKGDDRWCNPQRGHAIRLPTAPLARGRARVRAATPDAASADSSQWAEILVLAER